MLLRAGDFHGQFRGGGLDSAQDFARPQFFGEQGKETVLKIADRAEQIIPERGVVCVDAGIHSARASGRDRRDRAGDWRPGGDGIVSLERAPLHHRY